MDMQRIDWSGISSRPAPSSDLDLSPGTMPLPARMREAAVLVPLRATARGIVVVLTRRAAGLRHHPGQIAFPGGKIDRTDPSPEAAALREAEEEIGLPAERVRLRGRLATHRTVTGFSITPVLGEIPADFVAVPEAGEVAEVFEVPLSHVLDPANLQIHSRTWQGSARRYYAIPYGPHYVWGATARILKSLADGLGPGT